MRTHIRLAFILLGGAIGSCGIGEAQTPGSPPTALTVFDFPQSGVEFLTGDTWRVGGQTYRLYGVQSCIRGTDFTNAAGAKKDCGEASLAYTAAIVRDTHPRCTAVAQAGNSSNRLCGLCRDCGTQHARSRHDPHHRRVRVRSGRRERQADQPHLCRGGGRCPARSARPLGRSGFALSHSDPRGRGASACATLGPSCRHRELDQYRATGRLEWGSGFSALRNGRPTSRSRGARI